MKYIIAESRFNNILDKLFINRYGSILVKEDQPDGYIVFYDEHQPYSKNKEQPFSQRGVPFELNTGGNLWVNDYIFFRRIKHLFGLKTSDEVNELFKNYFKDRYGVEVKMVSSEGGYHQPGDDLDYADPWLDNED
jgi:hypothetical protein